MTHRGSALALVISMAAGCGCSNPPPAVPPPPTHVAEVPGQGDFARQTFASPLSLPDAEQILRRTEIFEYGSSLDLQYLVTADSSINFDSFERRALPDAKPPRSGFQMRGLVISVAAAIGLLLAIVGLVSVVRWLAA